MGSYRWNTGQITLVISVSATGTYVVTVTGTNGCSAIAAAIVTVKPLPAPPAVLSRSGQFYPGGVASLTLSQHTGTAVLLVSGCPGGNITWAGGNTTTLALATTSTCTQNGCTSPAGTATVVVVPTTLSVSHLDADVLNLQTNIIVPYLQLNNHCQADSAFNKGDDYSYANSRRYTKKPRYRLPQWGARLGTGTRPGYPQSLNVYTENKSLLTTTNTIATRRQVSNEGNKPVSYSDVKVRYYFTAEGTQPLNFFLDYAELGNATVKGQLVKIMNVRY